MIAELPPGILLLLGALLIPLLKGWWRAGWVIVLPWASLFQTLTHSPGSHLVVHWMGYDLTWIHVDSWSHVFGTVFHIAAALALLYSVRHADAVQLTAGTLYAGSTIWACYAGDWLTFFVLWESTSLTSVFLIWSARNQAAYKAGMRYLLFQVGSGVLLLLGILGYASAGGSLAIRHLGDQSGFKWLILMAIGIKCAFPFLHTWMKAAYPLATPFGSVFLCSFTTKLAVYILSRTFSGDTILVYIGTAMCLYGVIYAIMETNIRGILAYHIMSQLGYMVAGIGLGSALAMNGAIAHAFCNILFKALLFMGAGAVVFRTGENYLDGLGGLYRKMPWTLCFYMIGGFSISALPLLNGFISKGMIITAMAESHYPVLWLVLNLAAVGTFLSTTLKLPYYAFFGKERDWHVEEAPRSMLAAMAGMAFLCVLLGCYPDLLYRYLPFPVDYEPYTGAHVVGQLQLLVFSGLAFGWLLKRKKKALAAHFLIDVDWLYRKLPYLFWEPLRRSVQRRINQLQPRLTPRMRELADQIKVPRAWPISQSVLLIVFLLFTLLLLQFVYKA